MAADQSDRRVEGIGPVARRLASNLRQLRGRRQLTTVQLAGKLSELGRPIPATGITKTEAMTRRVDVDDLVALAIALGVTPDRLLLTGPITSEIADQAVELTPNRRLPVLDAWQWAVGDMPLFSSDVDVNDFRRENRPHEQPDHQVDMAELRKHPELVRQAAALVRAARAEGVGLALLRDFVELATLTAVNGNGEPAIKPSVVAAIVTSDLGVLAGHRNDRTPPWTFIAGEQEPGERPEDTAVREVKEETGLEIEAGEIIGERDHPKTSRHMIYLAGHPVRGTKVIVGDEAELDEVRWLDLDEANEVMPDMFGPVRTYLENTIAGDQ